jgi:protocatechuate 3,4-dioxygenase beta subunit/nitrogen fixation protein FixH
MSWYKNCVLSILVLLFAAVSMPRAFAQAVVWSENWTVLTSNGKPASGAVVRIYRSKSGDPAVTVTKTVADASGVFQLTYPNEGKDRWQGGHNETIFVSKANESEYIGTSDDKYSKTKVVKLIPAVTHKIHVVEGSSNKPVVGVPIFVSGIQTNQSYLNWNEQHGEPWSVKTDANGDATFPLIPKTGELGFEVGGDKYVAVKSLGQIQVAQSPAVETLPVVISGSVSGIVMIESTGAPVQTGIQAFRNDASGNLNDAFAQADVNGSFTFKKLVPGTYTISLNFDSAAKEGKEWTAPARTGVKVVSGQAASDVNFMLTRGAIIKGIVREKGTNKPVNNNPDWRVSLNFNGPANPTGESFPMAAQIQPDGSYQICVPPGDQTVNIHDQGAAPENMQRTETIHVANGETKEFNIDLEPVPKKMIAHGKVISADGAPASYASVYTMIGQYGSGYQSTDANGAFTINSVATEGVVIIATKNAARSDYATLMPNSDRSDLVLTLSEKPGATATGKVVDSSGKPLEGAEVHATFSRPGVSYNFTSPEYLKATTNKSGEYSIGPLFAGWRYIINANAPGYAGDETSQQVALPHKGLAFEPIILALKNSHVHGQVINLSEKPIAGATVSESGEYPPTNTTVTDKNGYFTLNNLPQGECNLSITAPGYVQRGGDRTKTGIDNAEFSLDKEMPAPKSVASAPQPAETATITGRVVDEQGKPIAGQSITMPFMGSLAKTDENGQYQFKNIFKSNSYTVNYYPESNSSEQMDALSYFPVESSQEIKSTDKAVVAKDIVLKVRDSFVAGKVVDPQGNPVKYGRFIMWQSKSNDWTQLNANGEFRFKVLSKGDITLSVTEYKTANTAKIVVQPGADNLVISLAPPKYHGDGANARKIVKAAKAKAISEGKALLIDLYDPSTYVQRVFFDDQKAKPILDKYFEAVHLDLYDVNVDWQDIDADFYEWLYKSEFIGISRSGKASVIDAGQRSEALMNPEIVSNDILKVLRQTEPKITDTEAAILSDAIKRTIKQNAQ